jgi:hypothetical protein
MFVSVTVRLDIDTEAWATDYGLETASEIRADVKEHVQNLVRDHLDSLSLLKGEQY